MKTFMLISFFLVSFLLFSSVGKVENVLGGAFIKIESSNGFKKLKSDFKINKGDVIKTMSKSSVSIKFNDGSVLNIYPKSIVKIDKNITDEDKSESITLFSGRLWAKIHKRITKKNFFRINTPTATAGVRGTSFGVAVSSNGSSLVKVEHGRVLFDSDLDPKALKEDKIEEKNEKLEEKNEENKTNKNLMVPQELKITTSHINREDNSISTDIVTGIKKNSIILGKESSASFRLKDGIKPEATIPTAQFEQEESMPKDPQKRKEIITWHISNLRHRVKVATHLVFKVNNIAGGIESMKSDKKFSVEQISATTKKGRKEMEHIAQSVESLENSMDAQLYFLENYAKEDPDTQKVLEEHKKFVEEKNKAIK